MTGRLDDRNLPVAHQTNNRRIPNLFIVGAPKSGTSSMHSYLAQHPEIFMSGWKEPHFFSTDLPWRIKGWNVRFREEYIGLFKHSGNARYRGESSTWYLCSTRSAKSIYEMNPDAKIVAMLREPVSAICSMFHQNISNGNEDIFSLRAAIAAEPERRVGHKLPSAAPYPANFYYTEMVNYVAQVNRYFQVFGRENVHVILFDDFAGNSESEFNSLLRFLGLNETNDIDFNVRNAARPIRNRGFRTWLLRHPRFGAWLSKSIPPQIRSFVGSGLGRFTAAGPSPVIEDETIRELKSRLAPSIVELSQLIRRDLSRWMRQDSYSRD